MTHTAPIQVESGDEVRGPHYRQWHSVIAPHTESTLYTLGMLYWECAKRNTLRDHAVPSVGMRHGDRVATCGARSGLA